MTVSSVSNGIRFDVFSKPAAVGKQLTVRLADLGSFASSWRPTKQIVVVDVASINSAKLEFRGAWAVSGHKVPEGSCGFEAYVVGLGEPQSVARFEEGPEGDRIALQKALSEAFEIAIFEAMRQQAQIESMHAAMGSANATPVAQAERLWKPDGSGAGTTMPPQLKRAGWRRFLKFKWIALASVVAIGGGLVLAGVRASQSPSPFVASNAADMDARVQAAISSSLRQPSNGDGLLQGQSVNIQTMRAMGLDPGKANTGCLVGVHK